MTKKELTPEEKAMGERILVSIVVFVLLYFLITFLIRLDVTSGMSAWRLGLK